MNKEEAKEILPIIQAFASGTVIQYSPSQKGWADKEIINPTNVVINPDHYRIKPEREEIWVNQQENRIAYAYACEQDAKDDELDQYSYKYIAKRFVAADE